MNWELPADTTRLVLVRHGEPDSSAIGRCYGRLDVALSPRGVEQGEAAAAWLANAPLAAVYSSPSRRALETARPIAAARGIDVQVHESLCEIDFGVFEGLTFDEAAARHPSAFATWMRDPTSVVFPGGEGYGGVRERVLALVEELRREHRGASIVLVSHGGPIRSVLAAGLRLSPADLFRIDVSYGAVGIIDYLGASGEYTVVRLLNGIPPEGRDSR